MARVSHMVRIEYGGELHLNEGEMRVLSMIAKAGTDEFIKANSNSEHARFLPAMRQLFKSIRDQVDPALADIDKVRLDIIEASKKRGEPPAPPATMQVGMWGDMYDEYGGIG